MECESTNGAHRLCSVQKRETLFNFQLERRNAGAFKSNSTRQTLAIVKSFTFATRCEREMGQRGEIAACADAAFLWYHRRNTFCEHRNQRVNNERTRAAKPRRQYVRAQQQHRASF